MFTAWQTGRFATYSGKKPPSLADALKELRPRDHKQTPEEIVAAMRAIRETMSGGEVSDAR